MRERRLLGAAAMMLLLGVAGEPEVIVHVVQPGETLWSISALPDVYADPYLWPLIYKFNRDQIKDPAHIYPSQRLLIPIHVDAETRNDARASAGAPDLEPQGQVGAGVQPESPRRAP